MDKVREHIWRDFWSFLNPEIFRIIDILGTPPISVQTTAFSWDSSLEPEMVIAEHDSWFYTIYSPLQKYWYIKVNSFDFVLHWRPLEIKRCTWSDRSEFQLLVFLSQFVKQLRTYQLSAINISDNPKKAFFQWRTEQQTLNRSTKGWTNHSKKTWRAAISKLYHKMQNTDQ